MWSVSSSYRGGGAVAGDGAAAAGLTRRQVGEAVRAADRRELAAGAAAVGRAHGVVQQSRAVAVNRGRQAAVIHRTLVSFSDSSCSCRQRTPGCCHTQGTDVEGEAVASIEGARRGSRGGGR